MNPITVASSSRSILGGGGSGGIARMTMKASAAPRVVGGSVSRPFYAVPASYASTTPNRSISTTTCNRQRVQRGFFEPPPPKSASSSPSSSSSPSTNPSSSSSASASSERHARHRLLYREIWPPLFKCLAYGSISYFSLHLLWSLLDSREQDILRTQEREGIEGRIRALRQEVAQGVSGGVGGVKEAVAKVEEKVEEKTNGWKIWRRG